MVAGEDEDEDCGAREKWKEKHQESKDRVDERDER